MNGYAGSSSPAVKRLAAELREMHRKPSPNYTAEPLEVSCARMVPPFSPPEERPAAERPCRCYRMSSSSGTLRLLGRQTLRSRAVASTAASSCPPSIQ
jgi:hypothetical protein